MNNKFILISLVLLCLHVVSFGQIKSLKIGEALPDVEIKKIINYTKTSGKISDFRGKLLIIDFWATWCSPCVASFPKLDSLQKKYKDKLQILPVTNQDEKTVMTFVSRMQKIKKLAPLSVTNDTLLGKYFKHHTLPHYVWINSDRNVIAITGSEEVNNKNIELALSENKISLPVKRDAIKLKILDSKPLFVPSFEGVDGNIAQYFQVADSSRFLTSTLTGFVEGLTPLTITFKPTFIRVTNNTIKNLYKTAMLQNGIELLNLNTIEVEIPDSVLYVKIVGKTPTGSKLFGSDNMQFLDWLRSNGYCYEIAVPSSMKDRMFEIMLKDLNEYFGSSYGIEGVIEKRNIKYLALRRTSSQDKMLTKGGKANSSTDKKFFLKIQNQGIDDLKWLLAYPFQMKPLLIDETNYTGKVDIELNCQLSDLQALNAELAKYDLKIEESEKLMNIAVIRKK